MMPSDKIDLPALAAHRGSCVSIYMPLHRSQPDSQQDPIRLKNLLRQAEAKLLDRGMRRSDAMTLLNDARESVGTANFWRGNGHSGLAVLIEPGKVRCLRTFEPFGEIVRVGDRYHLGPLVHAFIQSGQFLLLAVSANAVRLYRGDRRALEPIALPDSMPKGLRQVEEGTQFDKGLQFHTAATKSLAGARVGIMHGHGMPKDEHKILWQEYLRNVVHHLEPVLQHQSSPLLLAAVDYVHPIFRAVCRYPHLATEAVSGSPDEWSDVELHQRALKVAAPLLSADLERDLDRYRELQATTRVANHIETVMPAVAGGHLEVLFAARDAEIWGRFNGRNEVSVHRVEEPGDVDLLDVAISETIAKGGTPYIVERDRVPSRDAVAAILRP